jgi:hypothetical protein
MFMGSHSVPSYDMQGDTEDIFLPVSSAVVQVPDIAKELSI